MKRRIFIMKGDFEQHGGAFNPTSRRSVEIWGVTPIVVVSTSLIILRQIMSSRPSHANSVMG